MSNNGTIDFLRSDEFYRFDSNRLNSLLKIVAERDAVEHEFLDVEMEAIRKLFLTNCNELLTLIGAYTFPDPDSRERRQTVVRGELYDYSDEPDFEKFEGRIRSRMDEMQAAADNVRAAYEQLIRMARIKGLGLTSAEN